MATGSRISRRNVLQSATAGSAAAALAGLRGAPAAAPPRAAGAGSMIGVPFEPRDPVRLGIVGVGARGLGMLGLWLAVDNVVVTAICDTDTQQTARATQKIEAAGQKTPAVYSKNERDFENLCARDDVDFVYIATPWDWHVPMALAGMARGKHVGLEVPAALTLEECWKLVDASEKTRRHCMIMENCCYGYNEMLVLSMVRAGLFGALLHAEAAYNHDLRDLLFATRSEGLWRRFPHARRNANLYPTHGLGPVANYLAINRGDRFDTLVSMSSPALGLDEYREKKVPRDDPRWREKYVCGDVNTSLIRTGQGRTIMLQHNVTTPRPYDRLNSIQRTRGIFRDFPARIYLEGQEGGHRYTGLDAHKPEHESKLWRDVGEMARKRGGHGGMDYVMVYRVAECIRRGLPPDMDVYDAAAWSAPTPLSETSVAQGGAPAKFPDFTRGRWQQSRNGV